MIITESKITRMGYAIQQYLTDNNLSDVKPKDLMPMLIEKGFFNKDHRAGLPLREVLRELDRTDKLYLLPQVRAERKEVNTMWF